MSSATHTIGPWETDGRVGYLDVVCAKGRIAMVDCGDDAFWAAELEANASLIAAAPDLLAALQWAVETADTEQYEADWYAAARAAIAKAKGVN